MPCIDSGMLWVQICYPSIVEVWDTGLDWLNPELAAGVEDDQGANAEGKNASTKYLRLTGFGFSIPPHATITSLYIEIRTKEDSGFNSVIEGFYQKEEGVYSVTGDYYHVLAPVWNWGRFGIPEDPMWATPEEINSPTFGINVRMFLPSGGPWTPYVDALRIIIDFPSQVDHLPLLGMGP